MIEKITETEFIKMAMKFHYNKTMPRLNKIFLGDQELRSVMSLGWGVRPTHTIKKMFPSLTSENYYEIGKMCADECMPKNTESMFISRCIKWIKNNTDIKVLFTWADGMLGKPGYIYQASNFYYGGYIWTDTYISNRGERVHPRMTGKIGGRPNYQKLMDMGWTQYKGKQFRYVYFLCGKEEKKRLLKESNMFWNRTNYPKDKDLMWKVRTVNGWAESDKPPHNKNIAIFSDSTKRTVAKSNQALMFSWV